MKHLILLTLLIPFLTFCRTQSSPDSTESSEDPRTKFMSHIKKIHDDLIVLEDEIHKKHPEIKEVDSTHAEYRNYHSQQPFIDMTDYREDTYHKEAKPYLISTPLLHQLQDLLRAFEKWDARLLALNFKEKFPPAAHFKKGSRDFSVSQAHRFKVGSNDDDEVYAILYGTDPEGFQVARVLRRKFNDWNLSKDYNTSFTTFELGYKIRGALAAAKIQEKEISKEEGEAFLSLESYPDLKRPESPELHMRFYALRKTGVHLNRRKEALPGLTKEFAILQELERKSELYFLPREGETLLPLSVLEERQKELNQLIDQLGPKFIPDFKTALEKRKLEDSFDASLGDVKLTWQFMSMVQVKEKRPDYERLMNIEYHRNNPQVSSFGLPLHFSQFKLLSYTSQDQVHYYDKDKLPPVDFGNLKDAGVEIEPDSFSLAKFMILKPIEAFLDAAFPPES